MPVYKYRMDSNDGIVLIGPSSSHTLRSLKNGWTGPRGLGSSLPQHQGSGSYCASLVVGVEWGREVNLM